MKSPLAIPLLYIEITLALTILVGCKTAQSDFKTVAIAQSEVKNKKKIGFCWAYATTDFVESEFIKREQKNLNLSEEFLGFYRISEHIRAIITNKKEPKAILDEISCQRFQGLHIMKSHQKQRRGGFELALKYGLVPEEAYHVKFENEEQRTSTFVGIKKRLEALLSRKSPKEITDQEITEYVISGISINNGIATPDTEFPSNFLHGPPQNFMYEGRDWTPKTFFEQLVQVNLQDFMKHDFGKESDYTNLVTLVKKTLASGVSVPFGFGVDRNHLFSDGEETIFSGKQKASEAPGYEGPANPYQSSADPLKGASCAPKDMREYQQGRHAVIITDFVNEGGKPGASLNPESLQKEVDRPAGDLSYFIIKNSWGIEEAGHEGDEAGSTWLSSHTGYYRVDQEYLLNSLRLGIEINITVPKTIY